MMKNKYIFVLVMLLSILVVSLGLTNIYVYEQNPKDEDEFVVVTSFYPMYIATMNVVGDTKGVTVKNLSEPQTGCLHDFQMTPADMKLLSTADVFVINGGGMESFMEEIAAQYPNLTVIEASEGLHLLGEDHVHDHGENAHAWMSVALHRKQVENIADGLSQAMEEKSASFLANAKSYDEKLGSLQIKQEQLTDKLQNKDAIMLHCAYEYVAEDYGMHVAFCMDLDDEQSVKPSEVAEVIHIIKEDGVEYIFAEELYAADMCNTILEEADVTVIYLDPLTRGEYDADSYLKNMEANIEAILHALE